METSFNEIYCMNQLIKSDSRMQSYSSNDFYLIMWKYLQFAIADFVYDCKQDLNNYVPYSQTTYNFICDGIDKVFSLTPAPTQTDILFYIDYSSNENEPYTEITEYTYDDINNTITIDDVKPQGTKVTIVAYEIGKFNLKLTLDEKRILSEAMVTPWLEEQSNELNLQRFAIYGGSAKMYSQGEHIGKSTQKIQNQRDRVEKLINHYSYRKNPDGLSKLGGRYYASSD